MTRSQDDRWTLSRVQCPPPASVKANTNAVQGAPRPALREKYRRDDALYYRGAVTYAGVRARNDHHQPSIDARECIHRLNGNIIIPSLGPTMILPFLRAVDQDELRERPVPTGLPYASVGAGNAVVLYCACSSASVTA
jgi:hypothetical protein